MSLNFYFTICIGQRGKLYDVAVTLFPERMIAIRMLDTTWTMISVSLPPDQLDNTHLEAQFEEKMLAALRNIVGHTSQFSKVPAPQTST